MIIELAMPNEEKYLGYLKYSGKSVEEGLLDIRKSGEALLGFDEILRFFLFKEDKNLVNIEFDIPIRIRKGSWEALIPDIIDKVFSKETLIGSYFYYSLKEAAKSGFSEIGLAKDIKNIFISAIKSVQWVVKVASHVGSTERKKIMKAKPVMQDNEWYVEITNEKNEVLRVHKKYFDLFIECPEKLFSKNVSIVNENRTLHFGVIENEKEEFVSITENEKTIFYKTGDGNDQEIVLPELIHGQNVALEGNITRLIESTNTIGFRYEGNTISCRPVKDNIAKFKAKIVSLEADHVFSKVRIIGKIDRTDRFGGTSEKRPIILFEDIISLEVKTQNISLFGD